MRVSHGTMKIQGPVLGMKKLARAFIRGDLDRADRIDTALVKIAGCTRRLPAYIPKTEKAAKE